MEARAWTKPDAGRETPPAFEEDGSNDKGGRHELLVQVVRPDRLPGRL
jgi:hypothetical protein